MGIKVGLLQTQQKLTMAPEKLCFREEGRLQVEQIQREEKFNVSNAFRAGTIKNYLSQWRSITSDRFIIETVKWGLKSDCITKPVNEHIPQMAHTAGECEIISGEVGKLLKNKAIRECDWEKGDFISTVFTRIQKEGDMHTTLNLKQLNKHVMY